MTAKCPKGKISACLGMPPPNCLLQDFSAPVFQEEPALLKDFLRTFPEVVG